MEYTIHVYNGDYACPFIPKCKVITTGGQWHGEGNCMGWYGSEYLTDVTVLGVLTGEDDPGAILYNTPILIHKLPITSVYQSEKHSASSLHTMLLKMDIHSVITVTVNEEELARWNKE